MKQCESCKAAEFMTEGNREMFDTAVFDLDGTLLDTLEDLAGSVNHVMRTLGYPEKTLDEVRRSVGNGAGMLMERVLPGGRDDPAFGQAVQMHNEFYQAHCRIRTRPYDGIMEALDQLKRRGVKMAIVSNKGDGAVKELAREFFEDLIPIAVGEREGIRRKPSPDTVNEAIRQLGASKERTVYIGDSEVDDQTARNAGIPCILVAWGFRGRPELERFEGTDYLIDEARELPSFFVHYNQNSLGL